MSAVKLAWNVLSRRALLLTPLMQSGTDWMIFPLTAALARSSRENEAMLNLEFQAHPSSVCQTCHKVDVLQKCCSGERGLPDVFA